ncbi:MAG: o-succinylbenzoate--CoA ligase [Ktedonobacteraceae bacterium]
MNTIADTILPNWLLRSAENFPNHLAIKCGETRWTFAQLDEHATRLARQLAGVGVRAQSRVAILARNGLEYVATVHALTRLGAILVPLNIRLTHEELCWQIRDVKATFLLNDFVHEFQARAIVSAVSDLPQFTLKGAALSGADPIYGEDHQPSSLAPAGPSLSTTLEETSSIHSTIQPGAPEVDELLQDTINLAAIQSIMYTSGTTGTPKGVVITYGMHWWNAIGSALNLGHRPDDCWLACMPLFHVGGLSILMRSIINGISVIVQEKFDAATVNTAINEDHVTIISVVAVMLQRMLADLDTRGLRYTDALRCVLLGGGPAPQPLLEDCAARSIPVVQTYGLTESCSQAVTLSPADALRKLGSAGRPLLPVQLRIMNEGKVAAAGGPGIICLKGPSITSGYDHRPDATAHAIHAGWLSTDDIGYLDSEGYLYVLDRRSDLIISGGENIYPAEIEAILLSHPAVEEAGVCSEDDPQWGQVPIAFVHLKTGSHTDSAALLAYAQQRLARYKLPRAIHLVAQLPRNSSGKLLRRELPNLLHSEH